MKKLAVFCVALAVTLVSSIVGAQVKVSSLPVLNASNATYVYGITNASTQGKVPVGGTDGLAKVSGATVVNNCAKFSTTTGTVVDSGGVCGGAGAVTSVFTRTGAVVATTGDYTAAQVTNALSSNAADTISVAGAASTPGLSVTGNLFTGGTATTTTPQLYVLSGGALAPTGWSTSGTLLGLTAPASFNGTFMDMFISGAGTPLIRLAASGSGTVGNISLNNNVQNITSANNIACTFGTTGLICARNVADANVAMIVQQTNTGSTGDILQLKGGASGTTVVDAFSTAGSFTNSSVGAASLPGVQVTGVPFAGTGTTSFPQLYVNSNTATASTTLNVGGTGLGINVHSTGSPDIINGMLDGVSKFSVSSSGVVTAANNINLISGAAMTNSGSLTNGYYSVSTVGPSVVHNIADANPALIIQQASTTSTGDILQLKGGASGTTVVESTYKDGEKTFKGVVPTATTGCGTTPTIVGNNNVGRITIGTTPGTTCLVTFANTGTGWGANAPVCTCNDETTAAACRVSGNTTTTITLNAVTIASDKLDYTCVGYK